MRHQRSQSDHDPSLICVLDIETLVQPEHADPGGGFVKWVHHRPLVASVLLCEAMGRGRYEFELTSLQCEAGGERHFYAQLNGLLPRQATLVGWNTSGFDLPALALGAIGVRKFDASNLSAFHRSHRYGSEHLDLADVYGRHGAAPKPSLAEVCARIGVPVKTTSHGSHVGDLAAAGKADEIARYCEEDVSATAVAAWAWFAWRDANDALLAEPLAAFSRWIEAAPERHHLLGIANCEPARWARRRALVLTIGHARDRAELRLMHERRRRIFAGEEPLFREAGPGF